MSDKKIDAEQGLLAHQQGEMTLAELLTTRCEEFARGPKAVDIIDAGIEKLFKGVIESSFSRYSDFGEKLTKAMAAALPGNIERVIDLEKYNALVERTLREQWSSCGVGDDLTQRVQSMVREFTSEKAIPKVITLSSLFAAMRDANDERACDEHIEYAKTVLSEDTVVMDGYIDIGITPLPRSHTGSRPSNQENYLRLRAVNNLLPREEWLFELWAGEADGQMLHKRFQKAYNPFERMIMALWYGGSFLKLDIDIEDVPAYSWCDF